MRIEDVPPLGHAREPDRVSDDSWDELALRDPSVPAPGPGEWNALRADSAPPMTKKEERLHRRVAKFARMDRRFALIMDVRGPKVRLGVVWFVALCVNVFCFHILYI